MKRTVSNISLLNAFLDCVVELPATYVADWDAFYVKEKAIYIKWESSDYPNGTGICADLPKSATDARVVIDCPLVNITWTEPVLKYETKQIKTEL